MKRTQLTRKTVLKRKAWMSRTSELRTRRRLARVTKDADKLARRRAAQFGIQAALCRLLPCSVPGCTVTPCEPHHDPVRLMGGLDEDACPLCRHHHDAWHGRTGRRGFTIHTYLAVELVRGLMVWAYDHGITWTTESREVDWALRERWLVVREQLRRAT